MPSLISRGAVVARDRWVWFAPDDGPQPAGTPLLLTLPEWRVRRVERLAGDSPLGVWLEPDEDPAELVADLTRLELVSVHFPTFTEGRGYSTARLLRERHGYRGELRACGPFTRDLLFYLARCGFDAFTLREGEDPRLAMAELRAFDEVYQAAADRGALFERRFAARPPQATDREAA